MTLEQCLKLKEIGFPQDGLTDTYYTWEGYRLFPSCAGVRPTTDKEKWDYSGNWYDNPTAEEALAWVKSKLKDRIVVILNDSVNIIYHDYERNIDFNKCYDILSDAVYALIVWAYENKLLEGK